ncbi:MAG: STELLO glycosyltransferase family protein, partial [Deltaproteobacteria bacterium]|nr:STELLO glycosyltransferase family protein [Deltaproteobacteria bacterium]
TGTVSPFNSQNTAFIQPVFPLLYLPASVSFRSTDIIRGLVAQPILWRAGYSLGFNRATVVQDRNDHHYLSDFESEIPCYLYPEKIMDVVEGAVSSQFSIETNLINAYENLIRHHLIPKCEMDLLLAWVQDIQNLTGKKP